MSTRLNTGGSEKTEDPEASRLVVYYNRIDKILVDAIGFWKTTVDWDRGGFYGKVDYNGNPIVDAEKEMMQQVRHLWTFSNIYKYENDSREIKEICDHQFEFIRDKIYISSKKEFYKVVDSYGKSLQKGMHHYMLAFGIFALSNYAMAFPNTVYGQEALSMAKDVFYEMKNKSYDEVNGFDETVYSFRWCNDDKEINTQMHLMEAITYLYEAVKMYSDHNEEDVRSVLNNQVTLIYSKGIANQGDKFFCSRGYNKNWTVVNNWEVDYGHDIENVYLTMMAAKSLGRETEQAIINRVIELGKSVTTSAYDSNYGKWFYSGNPVSGQINEGVSNIWTNFEALNGLSTMYELTGETSYLEKFEKVLEWLEDEQMNDATKEWYYNVDDSGKPVNTDVFGAQCGWITFAWKSSYHSLRALMTRKEWIEKRIDLGQ